MLIENITWRQSQDRYNCEYSVNGGNSKLMFNPCSIETDSLPSKNLDGQIDRPVDTKLRLRN